MKAKVYIETSVVSYLTAWPRRDLIVAAHQALTVEWWQRGLPRYQPVISQFVIDEAALGDAEAARESLDALLSGNLELQASGQRESARVGRAGVPRLRL